MTDEVTPISKGMTDDELCLLIDRESQNAMGYNDLLADARKKGLEFYLGEATGALSPPEVDGRSSVVSKDLMDVVEWIMPSAMRLFTGTDEVATFQPDGPDDEKGATDATRLVQHVIMEQNEGFRVLHDAIKNCLIQRMAIVKVYCDDAEEERHERYDGLDELGIEALSADQSIEIVDIQPREQGLFYVEVKQKLKVKKHICEGVPPEEFGMSKEAKTIEDARYVEHKVKRTKSELISMGYDAKLVDDLGDDSRSAQYSGEEAVRRVLDDSWTSNIDSAATDAEEEFTLTEAYIRCDFDGDGISEYRKVIKAGTTILENEITDDHPFALFSPVLMPYRPIGLSMYDLTEDIVRIKTALTRQTLDSAYLAVNNRTAIVEGRVNMDDLLNPRVGGFVRVKDQDAMRELTTPFVGSAGLAVIEYFNKVRDTRTGATAFNQGVAGTELGGSAIGSNGVQDMMASAMQRIELMLRVISETGIKRVWKLMLKSLQQYQDRPMQLKVNGRWLEMNPREWKNNYRLTLSVGVAATSRQQHIGNIMQILTLQEKAIQAGLADPKTIHNALSRLTEAMGFRDADQFWTNPQSAPPQQEGPPQPDPKDVMDMQFKQAQLQTQTQLKQMDIDAQNKRNEADNVVKIEIAKAQIESAERIAGERIRADLLTKQAFDGEIGYNPEAVDQVGI